MRSSFSTVNGKRTSSAILVTAIQASCFRATRVLNLTRRAACSERLVRKRGFAPLAVASGFFLNLFFDLRPGIFQRPRAVKNRPPRLGTPVDTKIPEAFELITAFNWRIRQRWLQLSLRDHFQRVGIQAGRELLAFVNLVRVLFGKELVVHTHFGVESVRD